ncbi:Uncharacterised protein [uncultured Butyricicoccus sp.]|nr:Uncharacterised protein [uncultured Butyricicoccus sp.]
MDHVQKMDGRELKLRTTCSELFNCTFIMRKCRYKRNGHLALSEPLFCQYPISWGMIGRDHHFMQEVSIYFVAAFILCLIFFQTVQVIREPECVLQQ